MSNGFPVIQLPIRFVSLITILISVGIFLLLENVLPAQEPTPSSITPTEQVLQIPEWLPSGPDFWTSPEGLGSTLQVMLLLTVLSLAPAILLMTTCFVRIIVVLSLLRQALGTQQSVSYTHLRAHET